MELEDQLKVEYDQRFSSEDQSLLRDHKIEPALANAYHHRFKAWEIEELVAKNIVNAVAIKYPDRFTGEDITWLSSNNIEPATAAAYDRRFNGNNIVNFIYGVSTVSTNGTEVEIMVPPSEANKYSQRFSGNEVEKLVEIGLDADNTNQYDQRFDFYSVWGLWRAKIIPKCANAYPTRFSSEKIEVLVQWKISPETAHSYLERFNEDDLINLVSQVTPQEAATFSRFSGREMAVLHQYGVSSELADQYPHHFSGKGIAALCQHCISPQEADQYLHNLDGTDIVQIKKAGISLEESILYPSVLSGSSIVILHQIGITPKNTSFKEIEDAHHILTKIIELQEEQAFVDFTFLGTGKRSIVVLNKSSQEAYKFSTDLSSEERLLSQVKQNNSTLKNVITLLEFQQAPLYEIAIDIIKLEYINGKSLQQIIDSEKLSSHTIIQYTRNVLHGLQELRQAGIYHHRDIRSANIMIDEEKDRAVIIDLGIATTEKEALPKDNNRFGGPNDLVSLGQVMYFMATRQHLFTESDSMHVTRIKRDLKDERERVYADLTGKALEPYLVKVETHIPDKPLSNIVKECLLAKGTEADYHNLEEMFTKHAHK